MHGRMRLVHAHRILRQDSSRRGKTSQHCRLVTWKPQHWSPTVSRCVRRSSVPSEQRAEDIASRRRFTWISRRGCWWMVGCMKGTLKVGTFPLASDTARLLHKNKGTHPTNKSENHQLIRLQSLEYIYSTFHQEEKGEQGLGADVRSAFVNNRIPTRRLTRALDPKLFA